MSKKTTKRALAMSFVSVFLCVCMLVGTTFAWFTDSVTSGGNKIQSGTLDIDLKMWTSATESTEITNESDPIFGTAGLAQNSTATLWEPGKTQVVYLSLENNGNLHLKYKVNVNVKNPEGGKDLYKVMQYAVIPDAQFGSVTDWDATLAKNVVVGVNPATENVAMAPNAEHFFALAVHMDENAGNEYQGGTVEFDVNIVANQDTVEADSFDSTYDEDATRDSNIKVASASELQEAFNDAKDGDVITLTNNITVDDGLTLASDHPVDDGLVYETNADVTLDLGGYRLEGSLDTLLKVTSGNIVIKNGVIKNVKDNATETLVSVHLSGDAVAEVKNVTIETTGRGLFLEGNAKVTELNANVNSYVNANGDCNASAISLNGSARIDLISGGKYISTYTDEFIDAYSGTFSGEFIYPISINSVEASIGEISGGTFLGRADDGRNGATIYVNAGKIEKISGGYFGFCKYTMRNNPSFLITVNTANGAAIDAITGGTFEYAGGFGCDFENIVSQSGSTIEKRAEKATVTVKFSSSVKTKDVEIWDVVAP